MIKSLRLLEARTVYMCAWVLIPKSSTSLWKESLEINSEKKSYHCSSPLVFKPTYACTANKHIHHGIFIDHEQNEQGNGPPFITAWDTQRWQKFWSKLRPWNTGKNNSQSKDSNFLSAHEKQIKATLFDDTEEKHNHKTNREKLLIQKNKLTEKCFSGKALWLSLNCYYFKGLTSVFHSITSLFKNILTVCQMKSL